MSTTRRAVLQAAGGNYGVQVLAFVSIVVLARLLDPDEIGVFAIVSAISFFAIELRSFGAAQYLIRKQGVEPADIARAVGLMMLVSWSLALLLVASSSLVARFFGIDALVPLLFVVSGAFVLAPFTAVSMALLQREMAFGRIAVIKLIGAIVRTSTSIGLALAGFSYFALAFGMLFGASVEFVIAFLLRPAGTSLVPSFSGLRPLAGFGVYVSGTGLLRKAPAVMPDLVIGRVIDAAAVGLYSRGAGVVGFIERLLVQAVTPVALPHFSRVREQGPDALRRTYLDAVSMITGIAWPVFVSVALVSEEIVLALFGEKWIASAAVASWIALATALRCVNSFLPEAMLAIGGERPLLVYTAVIAGLQLIAVIVAAPSGIDAVGVAMLGVSVVEVLLASLVLAPRLGIGFAMLARACAGSATVALACGAATAGIAVVLGGAMVPMAHVLLTIGTAFVVLLGSIAMVRHPLGPHIFSLLRRWMHAG